MPHEEIVDRLASLEAENRELRTRLDRLERPVQTAGAPPAETTATQARGRRDLFKLAGAAAAGAVVGGLAAAQPAAADTGDNLLVGYTNFTQTDTSIWEGSGAAIESEFLSTGLSVVTPSAYTGIFVHAQTDALFASSSEHAVTAKAAMEGLALRFNRVHIHLGPLDQNVVDKIPPPQRTGEFFTAGSLDSDATGGLWYCVADGTPGTWRKLAGTASAGTFHPVTPGRVYDSRKAAPQPGVLAGGANRTVSAADRRDLNTGAVVEANFVPAGATAVAANVTIVSQSGDGYLAINPGGDTTVNASAINWTAGGQIPANALPLKLNGNRQVTVVAGGGGSTHFIVDVLGYYL